MSSYKKRKGKGFLNIYIILFSIVLFGLGYYVLNHISTMEKPFLGNTFHIVLGCTLMAISVLLFVIAVKKQFFPKKRKRTNHVFLENQKNNSES